MNARLTQDMYEILKLAVGQMVYSFSIEETAYNTASENNFRNYLTSLVSVQGFDFVIFNEIKQIAEFGFFRKAKKKNYVSFSVVKDCDEPDKIEGIFDMAVDETLSDVKIVTDSCDFIKGTTVSHHIDCDIAIILELETKKIVFQREEPWSDNLTIDVYKKDEESMFYIPLNYPLTEDERYKLNTVRKIYSISDLV